MPASPKSGLNVTRLFAENRLRRGAVMTDNRRDQGAPYVRRLGPPGRWKEAILIDIEQAQSASAMVVTVRNT